MLSDKWRHVKAARTFRGCSYEIEYINNGGSSVQISVDGSKISGDILPAFNDGEVHNVTVEISDSGI